VAGGGAWLDRQTVDLLAAGPRPAPEHTLSDRDQRILEGISEGQTNRRIAEYRGISEAAVKAALHRLYTKTQTRTRAQLLRLMLRQAELRVTGRQLRP